MNWQSGGFDVGAGSYEPCPMPLHIIAVVIVVWSSTNRLVPSYFLDATCLLDVVVTSRKMHCSPNARVTTDNEHWC